MIKRTLIPIVLIGVFLTIVFAFTVQTVQKVSMVMNARTLKDGKSISAKAEVYYRASGGTLVTRFLSPSEYLVFTNSKGEFKIYNSAENSVTQAQSNDYSSENSFLYYFLNGKTQDMGLQSGGYHLKETRFEDNMTITVWDPPADMAGTVGRAEIVQESYKPIFLGFYDDKGRALQKIYYSRFQKINDISIPQSITEIVFMFPKGQVDSVITKRTYEDFKVNEKVPDEWLNYKIPSNAKVVKS